MNADDEHIDIRAESPRRVLADMLKEAGRPELFKTLDENGLTGPLFEGIVALTLKHGAVVSQKPKTPIAADSVGQLRVLLGKRFHLKLARTIWQSLGNCLPLLVSIVLSSATDPAQIASLAAKVFETVLANLKRLDPAEWEVYLAVRLLNKRKQPSTVSAIKRLLRAEKRDRRASLSATAVSRAIENLHRKGAIVETKTGYEGVT